MDADIKLKKVQKNICLQTFEHFSIFHFLFKKLENYNNFRWLFISVQIRCITDVKMYACLSESYAWQYCKHKGNMFLASELLAHEAKRASDAKWLTVTGYLVHQQPGVYFCELHLPALPSGLASDGNQGPEPAPWLLAVGWTEISGLYLIQFGEQKLCRSVQWIWCAVMKSNEINRLFFSSFIAIILLQT